MKTVFKTLVRAIFLAAMFPLGVLSAFGRFRTGFTFCAHICAQLPGLPGDYARAAFYYLTLDSCPFGTRICYGTFFSTSRVHLDRDVYIGAYCIIGHTSIGAQTQIASSVHILSGGHLHPRDSSGRLLGSEHGIVRQTIIGSDCWIGEAAIVMADVGAGSTVGAGSVVTKEIPPAVVAAGNPAKVLRSAATV